MRPARLGPARYVRYRTDSVAAVSELKAMDKLIARLNIQHFRQRLAEEKEEAKRRTLLTLLAEEEEKLQEIISRERKE
jgi:hypothetical protein